MAFATPFFSHASLDFLVFDRTGETAAQGLADDELVELFAAIEHFHHENCTPSRECQFVSLTFYLGRIE
jgi:hypothetical protein